MLISNWYNTYMSQTKRTVIGGLAHDAVRDYTLESILYQTGAIGSLGRVDHRIFLILMNEEGNRGNQLSILKRHICL